jgi:hypothetical protein
MKKADLTTSAKATVGWSASTVGLRSGFSYVAAGL